MTWRCVIVAVLLCPAHATAQPEKRDYTFTRVHTFQTDQGLTVDLYNPSGQVHIQPAATDTLRVVEKIVIPATDSTYAMMFLAEAVVTYQRQQERVEIEALVRRPPHRQTAFGGLLDFRLKTRAAVHFDLYVPSGVSLEVATVRGAITARQTTSPMNLVSTGGRVEIRTATGEISVHSTTGAIEIANCTATFALSSEAGDVMAAESRGLLTAATRTGAIRVRNWSGDVRLESGQGTITALQVAGHLFCRTRSGDCLIEGHAGDVSVTSGSGDVTLTGFPQGCEVQISTISGHITGELDGASPRNLEAETRRGTIVSNLDWQGLDVGTRYISGHRESGSGRLYLETTEGQIRLSRGM